MTYSTPLTRIAPLTRVLVSVMAGTCLVLSLGACAPLVVGGAMVGGGFVATDRRTSGAQLEDEGIELRSNSRLGGERGHINVTSYNRQVLLTGEVASEHMKTQVYDIVSKVENVRSVVNELAVAGVTSLSQRSADTLVTGKAKAALVDAKDLSSNAFKLVTERGTLYMMGRVTQREADRATEAIRTVSGVQKVVRVLEIISEEELRASMPPPAPKAKPGEATGSTY